MRYLQMLFQQALQRGVASEKQAELQSNDAAYWMVNIARGIEQMDRIRFEAINPVFLMAATKPL